MADFLELSPSTVASFLSYKTLNASRMKILQQQSSCLITKSANEI